MLLLGSLYYGWAASQQGFGSFKQLCGANLLQGALLADPDRGGDVLAIMTGQDNATDPRVLPGLAGNDPLGLTPDGKSFGHATRTSCSWVPSPARSSAGCLLRGTPRNAQRA